MQLYNQISFKENIKEYNYLKLNSWYIKELNRGTKNYNDFVNDMKIMYKERATDKINNAIDNMNLITSVLDVLVELKTNFHKNDRR